MNDIALMDIMLKINFLRSEIILSNGENRKWKFALKEYLEIKRVTGIK